MAVDAANNMRCAPRVLVVADWAIDPHGVVTACRARAQEHTQVTFGLLIPARLHGLDWVGDPYASRPCAARQLESVARLAAMAGLRVDVAHVGDADPTTAIGDVRASFCATEILLCVRPRHVRHALDLAHRVRRSTGLTVWEAAIPVASIGRRGRSWSIVRAGGHCPSEPEPA